MLEALTDTLGVSSQIQYRQVERKYLHPGRTAEVLLNGKVIGFVGQVHPTVQKELDIKETYVFELSLKAIAEAEVTPIAYQRFRASHSITRDIALVVDKDSTAGELEENHQRSRRRIVKRGSSI